MLPQKVLRNLCSRTSFKLLNLRWELICNFSSRVSAASKLSASSKNHDWNRAVSDAEKIVGYPTTYFSVKCLLSEEFQNIAVHLRKLLVTNHPILKTAKRLIYHGRTNMQTRGLIVLLLSKAAGHTTLCSDINTVGECGVTERQQTLAEITEMIHTAHLIHKGILNLSSTNIPDAYVLQDLQFGNKISILSGDCLLANACKGLAKLRNCKVVDLISKSIGDFMQAEFLGEHDKQGVSLPTKGMTVAMWEEKQILAAGSLIGNSCKATLELAGHEESLQTKAFEFGKNLALAWQVYADLQPFADNLNHPPGCPFDLVSLPVIFHLEKKQHLVDSIRLEIGDDTTAFNFKGLYESIMEDDSVEKTRELLNLYSRQTEELLQAFGSSPSTKALSSIINSLRD